jgi:GGDEF domain-containing protein
MKEHLSELERLHKTLEATEIQCQPAPLRVTAAFNVGHTPGHGQTRDTSTAAADHALYNGKDQDAIGS